MVFATLRDTQYRDILNAKIKAFHDMLEDNCNDKISIKEWFHLKGLDRFVILLQNIGFKDERDNMEDLVQEDSDQFDELFEAIKSEMKRINDEKSSDEAKLEDIKFGEVMLLTDYCIRYHQKICTFRL